MSHVDPERRTRADEPPPPPDPHVGRTFDGFRIEGVIGRGGMGVVYKATQLSLNRPVAIKVMPDHVAEHPQFLERFHREVDVLSRLSHPNIVTVIDRGELDGHPYLVMEYVAGTSLREVIKEGSLPASEALVIVRGVLSALEHAHDRGIIHRDIKPENVLVAPGGIVKVADFGLGRLLGPAEMTRLTQTHLMLGTFEYMAPEQREKAKEADERADIFAVGVVLYELIAGELPIGHFERLSDKRPAECDSRIDKVVERSLDKSPERRYQRASEMGEAVSQLLTPVPLAPEPERAPAEPRHHRHHGDRGPHGEHGQRHEHHGRSAARLDWRIGLWLTALWAVPAVFLSPKPWRNESVVWVAITVGASMAVLARWVAKRPRPREDWSLGIGLTAAWVALVCVLSHKPWRDEEILWLGVGALLSAFLIPRLKEAGRFLFWIVAVAFVPIVVLALFWGVSSVDEPEPAPLAVATTNALAQLGDLPESELFEFDMSFFHEGPAHDWVEQVALGSKGLKRGAPEYLKNPELSSSSRSGLWIRFWGEDGYTEDEKARIESAWTLALHHWLGVDLITREAQQRLADRLIRHPLPKLEGLVDGRIRYFVSALPSLAGKATFPPAGAGEWIREALADIPELDKAPVHTSLHYGSEPDGRWGLWVEFDEGTFSPAEQREIVNAWAVAFSYWYGVRQAARPWHDAEFQADLRRKHPLPRIGENGER